MDAEVQESYLAVIWLREQVLLIVHSLLFEENPRQTEHAIRVGAMFVDGMVIPARSLKRSDHEYWIEHVKKEGDEIAVLADAERNKFFDPRQETTR
jgi:hypothetical protein